MRTCERTGKRVFETEREAKVELATIMRRAMLGERRGKAHWSGDEAHLETGIFECDDCSGFHLTARPWGGNIVNRSAS